jgi:hypothetical protein
MASDDGPSTARPKVLLARELRRVQAWRRDALAVEAADAQMNRPDHCGQAGASVSGSRTRGISAPSSASL